jgi:catechol 2,3-dioxygenase-like lactoylglutathione lyase family enzyme
MTNIAPKTFTNTRGEPARGCVGCLGIERGGYIAISTEEPDAAAAFAVDHMGFSLVHVDGEGRSYLAAHGLDPYSLVYAPGDEGIERVSYIVRDMDALHRAEMWLREVGTDFERIDDNEMWRGAPALRFRSPAGHLVQLSPGVDVAVPMAALVNPPGEAPAPISFDHVAPRIIDVDTETGFLEDVMGLKESARVVAPDVGPVISFFRAQTLFHCYTVVRGPYNGIHHFQFSLKNAPAVLAAYERMRQSEAVEVVWGPLRHGPGHNVAFYFRDYAGNFVEYSAEEEIILDGASYVAQEWSAEDPKFADEWGSAPPAVFFQ